MGKFQSFLAKSAANDRRRLGAIAVLAFEAVSLAALLGPVQLGSAGIREPEQLLTGVFPEILAPISLRFDSPNLNERSEPPAFYPYSVIPGGAHSNAELRNAVANDVTVRAHYADFVVSNARVERLAATQAFYVSYRAGNEIFWTKKPVTIPAGEMVLTDGTLMARTRCGNRLSAVLVAPTAPPGKPEPTPAAMEIPAEGGVLLATADVPTQLPLAPMPLSSIGPVGTAPPSGAPGIYVPFPPFFPIVSGGGATSPGTPGTPSPPTPPTTPGSPTAPSLPSTPIPPPPPIATPEPSVFGLLAVGIGLLLVLKKSG